MLKGHILQHSLTSFKIGAKRGTADNLYKITAGVLGAIQLFKYTKGDEPLSRAVQAGLIGAGVVWVGLVLMNGASCVVYNRYPQVPDIKL